MPPKKNVEAETETADELVNSATPIVVNLSAPVPMPTLQADPARQASLLSQIPSNWANPPAELISKLPKGGTQLDYMGHADVTLALIQIDPMFDYGWVTKEDGSMLINKVGDLYSLEGWVTVHGHTRRGVGTCEARKNEYQKELIGDLLRNCAMRFGIATTLWSKAERHEWGVPQDPVAAKAFDMLRSATGALDADQRARLRSWWSASFGDIPVSADAGTDRIVKAIAQVEVIASQVAIANPAPAVEAAPNPDEMLMEAFPGSEIVENSR